MPITEETPTLKEADKEKIKIDAKRVDVGKRRSQFKVKRRFWHRKFIVTFKPGECKEGINVRITGINHFSDKKRSSGKIFRMSFVQRTPTLNTS